MRSIKALDRELQVWYNYVNEGRIKLPRFQRFEAWDRPRITSLLNTVLQNLPLGVTLVLEVGDEQKFISRYLASAEKSEPYPKVFEQLLDGQQRLTAIWRSLQNNYPHEKYFLYLKEYDTRLKEGEEDEDDESDEGGGLAWCEPRWTNARGKTMPLWADDAENSFERGCIPFDLLKPPDVADEIDSWIDQATCQYKPESGIEDYERKLKNYYDLQRKISDTIKQYRETIRNYNLPFLSLPSETPKETALSVFVKMNTNSKPLSTYDIIVAEIEGVRDTSLHDLQAALDERYPTISGYFDLSYLILYTSALIQDKLPNRKGIWDMDKAMVVSNWDRMQTGLFKMATFLESQRIYDRERLPTNAVLAVIAALYTHIPATGDASGQALQLLKRYLWTAFFTDRYDRAAASRAYADFLGLKDAIVKPSDRQARSIPIFDRALHPLATARELLTASWPKNESIRGRGVLAVANYFGAEDFADGNTLVRSNLNDRQYHHLFPDSLIAEAMVFYPEMKSFLALNCALITDKTNYNIGRKDPLKYIKERYKWTSESVVEQRLTSHLIPTKELAAGDYEGLDDQAKADKVKRDYEAFLLRRAQFIAAAAHQLANGEQVYAPEVIAAADIETVES
jgi:hypothetical protein